MTLKDFVNKKMASAEKVANAEGYPLQLNDCKKYKKMKQLEVYGNSYQDGTPSPENPIEVQHVGDKTINLFDVSKAENGALVSSNGKNDAMDNRARTNYIFLTAGDYVCSVGNGVRTGTNMQMYSEADENTWIDYVYGQRQMVNDRTFTSFTLPSDCYIRFVFIPVDETVTTNISAEFLKTCDVMLTKGSNRVSYEPYGKYKIPVTQRGINIFPENLVRKTNTTKGITVDYEGNGIFHIYGEFDNTNGSSVGFNNTMFDGLTLPIDLKAYYTMSAKVISGSCSHNVIPYLGTRDATTSASGKINWIDISIKPDTYESGSIFSKTVLGGYGASANATGIKRFWFYWYIGKTVLTVDMRIQVWLTKSSTRLPYEPYVEPVTTNIFLDEPLRIITNVATGTTQESFTDTIDFKNKKVNRRLYEYYIDGRYTPRLSGDTAIIDTAVTTNSTIWKSWQGHSNRFSRTSGLDGSSNPYILNVNASGPRLGIRNYTNIPGVTDLTTLKQWLTENPLTYVAQLTTPKEEPLDIELPKLNTRTTIIEVGTSLAPSNLSGKYIKR